MEKIYHGRRRPFAEELPPVKSCLSFSEKEVSALKEYYLLREKWYELAIIAGIVFAFLFALAITLLISSVLVFACRGVISQTIEARNLNKRECLLRPLARDRFCPSLLNYGV